MKKYAAILMMVLSTSAMAGGQQCINSKDGTDESRLNKNVGPNIMLFGDICGQRATVPAAPTQEDEPRWSICVNGVSLTGVPCDGWIQKDEPRNRHHVRGRDAINLIRTGDILSSWMDNQGSVLFIVSKHQYVYSCRANPANNIYKCQEWRN